MRDQMKLFSVILLESSVLILFLTISLSNLRSDEAKFIIALIYSF